MSVLEYIASYDDLIQFCGSDQELGKKHKNVFSEKESRVISFNPFISCASNKSLLNDIDVWKNVKAGSKKGRFDPEKYTTYYIKTRREHLEDTEKPDLKKNGFDPFAYLMAYEEDIKHTYKDSTATLIQKATLHFIEIGFDEKPIDYLRYMATYKDIILAAYTSQPPDIDVEDWMVKFSEYNYINTGKDEIIAGTRKVDFIFDPTKYVATYIPTKDAFTNPVTGVIDEKAVTLAYITVGASNGLHPDLFNPFVFLSNYPELVNDDIYIKDARDGEISTKKLSKIWIDKFPHNIDLTRFDMSTFKVNHKIGDDIEAFRMNAIMLIKKHQKEIKRAKTLYFKIMQMFCVPS